MMKKFIFFSITLLSINCYSQIIFEKGYYIDDDNQKVECLIKNNDWKNNPTDFEYKLSENSEIEMATKSTIKEFAITNVAKYIRRNVNIDRSSEEISKLSSNKKPIFKEEELFLKVLIEGKANLYLYESVNLVRFFYSTEDSAIEQLVFKSYKTQDNRVGKNISYKQQLWNDLKCPKFTLNIVKSIDYERKALVRFFVEYNECNNQEYINFDAKQQKDLFNLTIRPGLNYSSLSIHNDLYKIRDAYFENEFAFRFGVEAEFIMPFNKNKWSVIIEPTYHYFKSEKELLTHTVKADYKSMELPIGIRHYFFLTNNSKIFINGSYILDFVSNSKITINNWLDLEMAKATNLGFGIGYTKNDTYSLEFRYQTSRNSFKHYQLWYSNYSTVELIFGYTLF